LSVAESLPPHRRFPGVGGLGARLFPGRPRGPSRPELTASQPGCRVGERERSAPTSTTRPLRYTPRAQTPEKQNNPKPDEISGQYAKTPGRTAKTPRTSRAPRKRQDARKNRQDAKTQVGQFSPRPQRGAARRPSPLPGGTYRGVRADECELPADSRAVGAGQQFAIRYSSFETCGARGSQPEFVAPTLPPPLPEREGSQRHARPMPQRASLFRRARRKFAACAAIAQPAPLTRSPRRHPATRAASPQRAACPRGAQVCGR